MFNYCCVRGCASERKDVKLHVIPSNTERRMKWLSCHKINFSLSPNIFVCHKHFEKKFITAKQRLRQGAYPTLFTADEISSGLPCTIIDNINPKIDHCYSKFKHEDHLYCKHGNSKLEVPGQASLDIEPEISQIIEGDPKPEVSGLASVATETEISQIIIEGDPKPEVSGLASLAIEPEICQVSEGDAEPEVTELASVATETEISQIIIEGDPKPEVSGLASLAIEPEICQVSEGDAEPEVTELASVATETEISQIIIEGDPKPEVSGLASLAIEPEISQIIIEGNSELEVPELASLAIEPAISQIIEDTAAIPKKRKRVLGKVQQLTPKCKKLFKEFKLCRRKLNFSERARKALKYVKNNDRLGIKNPYARKFIEMQLKLDNKHKKGRRFTLEEKLISLTILKQSPKCYRFLQRYFILPSRTTLNKLISGLELEVGINPQIFDTIKNQIINWPELKKYCTIIFDEVALEAGLNYNKSKDEIDGFAHLLTRQKKFADHALVFFLRGALWKWKQPLAYYYCAGATSGVELKQILTTVVNKVSETGLIPVALVCDQGTAFQSAIKLFQDDTRRQQILDEHNPDETIQIGITKLNVVYDPPHLIKGIRNNFVAKNIKYDNKISKWDDIVEVYKTDCSHAQIRLLHKLNDEHVIPDKIKKMKVKNCVRVLSKTMAAALNYTAQFTAYSDGRPVSKTLKNTAEIVEFFDSLFDSVNGASLGGKHTKGKDLRTAVTSKSKHIAFWISALEKLSKIKFIDKKGKEVSVPTLRNWIVTLKSFIRLWNMFKEKNVKIMRPRYFNSDPIKKIFSGR